MSTPDDLQARRAQRCGRYRGGTTRDRTDLDPGERLAGFGAGGPAPPMRPLSRPQLPVR
ncbi:hypothetical protein [Mycobacterium sp.]|uniref:hypothetical protein n=1 Tax=Mycobacterium sp. TaxID=1785 RepID=UPI003F967E60